ncbi:TB2/DP1, HVA22 family-domain-containing protein [Phlyctochytrium arcticum]|nr:TB2/DP1, HVA22 family-domain-containing protein [Phlyctochytrium arcticum]
MVFVYIFSRLLGNLMGYVYPAYLSYKAVKARDMVELDRWLIHWIVMASFTIAEIAGDTLLFWVPLYYEFKLLIILWLVLPYSQGSLYLYKNFLQPTLAKHEGDIDDAMIQAQAAARQMIVRWGQRAFESVRYTLVQVMLTGQLAFHKQQQQPQPSQPQSLMSFATEFINPSVSQSVQQSTVTTSVTTAHISDIDDFEASHESSDDDEDLVSKDKDYRAPRSVAAKPRAPKVEPERSSPRKRVVQQKRSSSRQRIARAAPGAAGSNGPRRSRQSSRSRQGSVEIPDFPSVPTIDPNDSLDMSD